MKEATLVTPLSKLEHIFFGLVRDELVKHNSAFLKAQQEMGWRGEEALLCYNWPELQELIVDKWEKGNGPFLALMYIYCCAISYTAESMFRDILQQPISDFLHD